MPSMRRVVIVHSREHWRETACRILAEDVPDVPAVSAATLLEADAQVCGEATECLAIVEMQGTVRRTIDLLLPFRRRKARARFAIVAQQGTRRDLRDCSAAGLAGFLLEDLPRERFVTAVQLMLDQGEFVPATVAGIPIALQAAMPLGDRARRADLSRITDRQKDVLKLLVLGMSNRDIAMTLGIAEATAKVHVAALLRLLGVKTRDGVARVVLELGSDPAWAQALDIETLVRPTVSA
ncbi:LuxR C-terminal-related transcriptional regulator [Alsobacter sp. R-9]